MKRFTRYLVRLYPRPWRERYGTEFEALLEDANIKWFDVLDVMIGALQMHPGIVRKSATLAAFGLGGLALGLALTFALPPEYRSGSVLRIGPAKSNSDDVLRAVAHKSLRRESLAGVIRAAGLYQTERERLPLEDVVDAMRRNVEISPDSNAGDAWRIAFSYEDGGKAQRAVAEMTQRFLDQAKALGAAQAIEVLASADVVPMRRHPKGLPLAGLFGGILIGVAAVVVRRPPSCA